VQGKGSIDAKGKSSNQEPMKNLYFLDF